MNKDSLEFFEKMAKSQNLNTNSVKLAKNSDFSNFDSKFILKHCNENSEILDLAAGTGLVINKLYKNVKKIIAVEPFIEFTKFIEKSKNIGIENQNIFAYNPKQLFDIITLFGIMHYLDENEARIIYEKYKSFLKPRGKLIIKNQFGTSEDVTVKGFSEELNTNYYAQYRHTEKEIEILKKLGYENITITDIYPPDCNRWENTHFYAIVAEA